VLRTERNPGALHARIAVRALPSAWTHAGINLGSSRLVDLKAPRGSGLRPAHEWPLVRQRVVLV
jgi:hypothetical protein